MKRIAFSDEMIIALLAGRKTMTRREVHGSTCPYGQPGAVLAATEAFVATPEWPAWAHKDARHRRTPAGTVIYRASFWHGQPPDEWSSPRVMKAEWSRAHLHLTAVRQERVQEITDEDAWREGVAHRREFQDMWLRINGWASWRRNVAVWVLSFDVEVVR